MLTNIERVNVFGKLILTLNPLNPQMQSELHELNLHMPNSIDINDASGNSFTLKVHDHNLCYFNANQVKLEMAISMIVNVNPDAYSPITVANVMLNELYMDLGNMLTLESLGGNAYFWLIESFEINWEAAFDQYGEQIE